MTDIVERLDRIGSDLEFGLHVSEVDIVAAVCEASAEIMARDAEIVRLRGEVGKLQILLDGLALSASIAPAEAKGEAPGQNVHTEHCCREHGCKYGDAECPVGHGRQVQSYPCDDCTPQPADGGAVAVGPLDLSAPPRVFLQVDTDGDDDDRSEAIPREAWGDLTWHHERIGGQEVEYVRKDLAHTKQSADGAAAAFYWRRDAAGDLLTIEVSEYESWGKDNRKEDTYSPAYTHPPAAQVQPNYTTGHCKNKQQPGGCRLHNLHCGFPECDRRKAASTHHTGDALGAVRERVAKMIYEQWTERASYVPWVDGGNSIMQDGARSLADAALQHRGDSRGGEASP